MVVRCGKHHILVGKNSCFDKFFSLLRCQAHRSFWFPRACAVSSPVSWSFPVSHLRTHSRSNAIRALDLPIRTLHEPTAWQRGYSSGHSYVWVKNGSFLHMLGVSGNHCIISHKAKSLAKSTFPFVDAKISLTTQWHLTQREVG